MHLRHRTALLSFAPLLLFLLQFLASPTATAAEPKLVESHRIWDAAPHNAFTDLVRHNDEWLCVFREGQGHVAPGGAIRIIASNNGREWTSAALLSITNLDLRDPKITLSADGKLMLYAVAADRPKQPITYQSLAWFSDDGRKWTEALEIADKNVWLWRVAWNGKEALGVGYGTGAEQFARLYKTTDGKNFTTIVPSLITEEHPNESGLAFDPDGRAYCLLRRDGKPGHGLLGSAQPPYTNWQWKDIGAKIGGPKLLRLPDGRLIAGLRLYEGGAHTSIISLDKNTGQFTELVRLPSSGDCSYPGLVWQNNKLSMTYYSSHEGRTMIYWSEFPLP